MEGLVDDTEEDEVKEPQLTSDDPNERKLARKLRLERRLAAIEKNNAEETSEQSTHDDPIRIQIDNSLDKLSKLLLEGDEYVTNIRIANENREINRRESEISNHENIVQQIDDEANRANESFNDLMNRWTEILNYKDPLDLHDALEDQRENFNDILQQKDDIIKMLNDQIKRSEVNYSEDQLKQESDINMLIRRIEHQISVMRKAFSCELNAIEQTILEQQRAYLEASNKEFEKLLKKRDNSERKNLEMKFADMEEFNRKMKNLENEYDEVYRETKIKMENECNRLQCEFEKMKALLMLNREKLDYNYQILKMKESENIIIKSQQRRRLNKLQETISNLRKKINQYQKETNAKINLFNKQINYLRNNICEIEKRSVNFNKMSDEKFKNLWKFNREKLNNIYTEILKIDRLLYEDRLGIPWEPPVHDLTNTTDLSNCKSLLPFLVEIDKIDGKSIKSASRKFPIFFEKETRVYRRLLKHVLEEISKKGNFLIDDQIIAIMKPYSQDEKILVTIDNVFNALNIHNKDDIDILLMYFLPYMYCPICEITENPPTEITESSEGDLHEEASILHSPESEILDLNSVGLEDEIIIKHREQKGDHFYFRTIQAASTESVTTEDKFTCRNQHQLVINSVYVLQALKDFLGDYHRDKSSSATRDDCQEKPSICRRISESDVSFFWSRYKENFSDNKTQLWDSLCEGLKKYHQILKERKSLCEEVVNLRRQNSQLKSLFA